MEHRKTVSLPAKLILPVIILLRNILCQEASSSPEDWLLRTYLYFFHLSMIAIDIIPVQLLLHETYGDRQYYN